MHTLPLRTRRLARALAFLAALSIVGVLAMTIYVSAHSHGLAERRALALLGRIPDWPLGVETRAMLVAGLWVAAGATLFVLGKLVALLWVYADGDALSHRAARAIRGLGLGLLVLALVDILQYAADGLAVTLAAPEGQRMLALAIGSDTFMRGFAGAVMLLIGVVMVQAASVAEDHARIV